MQTSVLSRSEWQGAQGRYVFSVVALTLPFRPFQELEAWESMWTTSNLKEGERGGKRGLIVFQNKFMWIDMAFPSFVGLLLPHYYRDGFLIQGRLSKQGEIIDHRLCTWVVTTASVRKKWSGLSLLTVLEVSELAALKWLTWMSSFVIINMLSGSLSGKWTSLLHGVWGLLVAACFKTMAEIDWRTLLLFWSTAGAHLSIKCPVLACWQKEVLYSWREGRGRGKKMRTWLILSKLYRRED